MQNNIIFKAQSEAQYNNILAKLKAKGYYLSFSQKKLNNLAINYNYVYMLINKPNKWVLYENESDIIKIGTYYVSKLSHNKLTYINNEQSLFKILGI